VSLKISRNSSVILETRPRPEAKAQSVLTSLEKHSKTSPRTDVHILHQPK